MMYYPFSIFSAAKMVAIKTSDAFGALKDMRDFVKKGERDTALGNDRS